MGLLDSLFGGGTKLDLKLDTNLIPEGGTLSGAITLSGGKKPLELKALKVRLVYVKVTPVEGQPLPKIDLQVLLDNTLISNQPLPPASLNKYEFSFPVPKGTDPKGTYKVIASADIPKVKDPSAEAELKVIGPSDPQARPGLFGGLIKGKASKEDILGQFPGLLSRDEDELCNALNDLLCASYDEDKNFVNIEGWLGEKMRAGTDRVKAAALAAWGNILNNRAKPEHIKTLEAMAELPDLQPELMRELVTVAAKFAEEGAMPLVQRLCKHANPEVRSEMAIRLYLDADHELKGRKELLLSMRDDPEASVRASVFRAFAGFNEDPAVMEMVAARIGSDPSPDAQKSCVSALALAHHHGMKDLVLNTFLATLKNPHSAVRKELAESVHWMPEDVRLNHLVGGLLSDQSQEVRAAMAWQSVNMSEHPELKDLFVKAATSDPDEEVRGNALGGLDKFMGLPEAVTLLRERLQKDPTEKTHWGAFNLLKFQMEHPLARDLMQELTRAPFARISERAREEMAGNG
ncbi:MAG: HEAT repeat domain-containing protein [Deltaproteobacteria bacterium]|nr:HEAT repeat domain-containing protein [Deltaproteobacteria bacterium]